jgi:hypothetical protein
MGGLLLKHYFLKHIDGVMVNVLESSAGGRSWVRVPFRSNQLLYNWYLLLLAALLRSKSKDCLARNQNNLSEWSDMFANGPGADPGGGAPAPPKIGII